MSKYKRIKTKITDRECLRQAFVMTKLPFEFMGITDGENLAQALKATGIPFERGEKLFLNGYSGKYPDPVEFVIRKEHLGSFGDLGFRPVDGQYEVIVDDMDRRGQEIVKQVQQQYAVAKVTKEAQAKGYTVVPQKAESGVIRLQLRRY